MTVRAPRRSCWEFLRDAERSDLYLNIAISDLQKKLDSRDRGFATELIFGSVRMRGLLDHYIDRLSDRTVDDATRSLLRIALYEALFMSTAEYAVVNEYVDISKAVIGKARAGFVNAILRRALREKTALLEDDSLDLATRTSHPRWIVEAYSNLLTEPRLEIELSSHNRPADVHVVSFEEIAPDLASKSEITPYGYRALVPPIEIDAIRKNAAFVQDEGSQILCEIALSTDHDRSLKWLDLCAGPGGKFAYLAHFLSPELLQANELHGHRARLVQNRAPRHHVRTGDATTYPDSERFDRIMIDAPCTGIGALRRRPDARWRRTEADLKNLVALQRNLLMSASKLLNPNGIIIYTTCSPHLMETKAQVADFLGQHRDFQILPITHEHLSSLQIPDGANLIDEKGQLQIYTSDFGSDAMFMSLLQKTE